MQAGERGSTRLGRLRRTAAIGLLVVLTGCGGTSTHEGGLSLKPEEEAGAADLLPPPSTTATTAAPTTTTTAPAPPPAQEPAPSSSIGQVPPDGLGPGARGPQVAAVEQRLAQLKYDVHTLDDAYDHNTAFAVVAFQKQERMARTGRVTQDVADRLGTASAPGLRVPGGGPTRIEIDLPHQIMLVVVNDALERVLPVSTASGKRFCDGGRCRRAVTHPGSFRISRRIAGWHESDLGRMYNPMYYRSRIGVAIHGFQSVPNYPASHGCVRIPLDAADPMFNLIPNDTPVYVLDGVHPPPPAPPPGTVT